MIPIFVLESIDAGDGSSVNPKYEDESGVADGSKQIWFQLMRRQQSKSSAPTLVFSRRHRRDELREATDRELLAALRHDDEMALDELIERKSRALHQVAYRILNDHEEAKDIVQVTFVRLWDHRQRFDEKWSPNTWIYRIATNLAIDQLRSRQSRYRSLEPIKHHLRDAATCRGMREAADLEEQEVQEIFHELAASLTEKQRTIFLLREVQGFQSKEVAAMVDCRESTVRNHLFNARKILRRELAKKYPEYAGQRPVKRSGSKAEIGART